MSKLPVAPTSSTKRQVLPSSVSQVGTVSKYELVNYFRSRRFFVLLGIGFTINGILTALVGYYGVGTFASSALGFYAFWGGNSIQFIIQTLVSGFAQIEPWFILTYGSGIIGNVLADKYPATQVIRGAGPGGREGTTFNATIPEGLAIILGYFVVTAILGLLLFERKEFT